MGPKTELDKTLEQFLSAQTEDKRRGFTIANLFTRLDATDRKHREMDRAIESLMEREGARDERVEEAHDRLNAHRDAIVQARRRERRMHTDPTASAEFEKELDTGSFDLVAIQTAVNESRGDRRHSERVKALELSESERRANATWWRRHAITVLSGISAALIISLITTVVVLAIAGARQPTTTQPK